MVEGGIDHAVTTREKNFLEELLDVKRDENEHQMGIEDNEKMKSAKVSANHVS